MLKTKFITLLKVLSAEECREFYTFLKANFPSKKKDIKVFTYIFKYKNRLDHPKLQKEVAIPAIFKNATTSSQKDLSNALSRLYGYLEEYLLFKKMQSKPFYRYYLLAEIYKERGQQELFINQVKNSEKQLDKTPERDLWYLYKGLPLAIHKYFSLKTNRLHSKKAEGAFQDLMSHLDEFFMSAKLKFAIEYQQRRKVLQQSELEIHFLKEVEQYILKHQEEVNPVTKIYFLIYQLNKRPNDFDFNTLKELVMNHIQMVHPEDQSHLYKILLNKLAQNSKKGNYKALEEALEIFQFGLKHRLALADGIITAIHFNNIVDIACKVDKIEWAKSFIKQWKKYLPPEEQIDAEKLVKCTIAFSEGRFDDTLALLIQIQQNDIHYKTRIKWLFLCCYYELSDPPEQEVRLISFFKNYEVFFKSNKDVNPDNRKGSLNLLRFVKYLFYREKDVDQILKELKQTELIFFKTWLLKKIDSH
jgi:hypothetical protein